MRTGGRLDELRSSLSSIFLSMRATTIALALALAACGTTAPTPAPVAPSPPPPPVVAPTAPPPTAVAPTPPAPPARVSPESSRTVAAAVAEARREAHAGHLPEALAAFDRALALVPGQPRVLCEAGFIAHRAGDEAGAARRIDSALHVFGPADHIGADLRDPLAMCLYNRGLVAEAQHDGEAAARAYEASLALRPNRVVSAALARAQASVAIEDDEALGVRVGGALVEDDLVRVTSLDALTDVLRHGMRGFDEDGEDPVAPSAVTVHLRATLQRPGSGAEIALLDVDDGAESYREQRLVVAERTADGYRVGTLQVGAQDLMVSESEGDSHLSDVQTRWDGDVLVIQVSTTINEGSFDSVEDDDGGYCNVQIHHVVSATVAVICRAGAACVKAPIAHGDSGADVYRECVDEDGEERAETAADAPPTPGPISISVRLRVEGDTVIVEGTAADDEVLAPGRHPLSDLDETLDVPSWLEDAT